MNKSLRLNSPSSEYVVYERILGRGVFGVVLLAKQVKTLRNYAMKIINKHQLEKANGLQNVRQEILLQTKIQHPNIVSLIESFEDDQYIYLVLEYCAKGNLFTYINQNGPLTESVAYKYFIQIASGINYIHQQGIIHRDIKLDNLLLNDLGEVKICDFNWATQMKNGLAEPIICGTIQYMPPEVHFNYQQNSKLDIWSLGMVLYELMHCKLPFEYNTSEITMMETISAECQQLVRQMLSLNHKERPNIKQVLSSKWIKKQQQDQNEHLFTPRYHHHHPQHSLYIQQTRLATEY